MSSILNTIGSRFSGATPSGGPRRSASAPPGAEGGLGEALLSGAYTLLSWMGATPMSRGEDTLPEPWSDPAPIALAARRASDAERAAAAAAWGGGARGGGEAGTQLAVTLACGCVRSGVRAAKHTGACVCVRCVLCVRLRAVPDAHRTARAASR
jgi:hypothetical protein